MTVARPEVVTTARHSSTTGALSTGTIGKEFLAPLDDIDFDAIEADFDMGVHSTTDDLANHVIVCVLAGVDPSDSLGSLETKTATLDGGTYMPKSRVSELTNDRPCQAILEVLSELLHSRQLYRRRAHLRKRLEWLDRPVIASDASTLSIAAPVSVPEGVRTPTDASELQPEDGDLKLNLATRVDGQSTHPLAATVTGPNTHETTQYDQLADGSRSVTVQDNPIEMWDRGYTDYNHFCAKKRAGEDFVTTLKSNSRTTLLTRYDEFEVCDEAGTRLVTDDLIVLGETGGQFRRITRTEPDDEVTAYLTTLPAAAYDPIDIVSIYTLRTLIEIFFRETKEYMNVENFHSTTLNGVLFEMFATLLGYLLMDLYQHRHPHRGGTRNAIRTIQLRWNDPAPVDYG